MKFFRLTSVFLCCALLSSFLILSASAADDDDYYSAPVVADGSASVAPASLGGVMLASATSWDTNDRAVLQGIYKFIQYMVIAPSSYSDGSIIGLLHRILNSAIPNPSGNFHLIGGEGTNDFLDSINKRSLSIYNTLSGSDIAGNLGNIQRNTLSSSDRLLTTNTSLSSIYDAVTGINGYATETTLSSFLNFWKTSFSDYFNTNSGSFAKSWNTIFTDHSYLFPTAVDENGSPTAFYQDSWFSVIGNIYGTLFQDYKTLNTGNWSLYHHIANLSETLASDDDKKLAQSQKENREQIEKDFVSGSSGKTSLGKDDFGSLSSVGGTFKDTISLNGQSSIGDLTSGLSDADTVGQGWFSQATKDSLDAVSDSSSESTVSTFSDDGLTSVDVDPDPYHMQGFEDNYAWLWGDD